MSTKRTRNGASRKKWEASDTGTSYPGVIDRAKVSRGRERPSNEENLSCILKDFLSPSKETYNNPSESNVTKYQNAKYYLLLMLSTLDSVHSVVVYYTRQVIFPGIII